MVAVAKLARGRNEHTSQRRKGGGAMRRRQSSDDYGDRLSLLPALSSDRATK